jgi:hypothetical protein
MPEQNGTIAAAYAVTYDTSPGGFSTDIAERQLSDALSSVLIRGGIATGETRTRQLIRDPLHTVGREWHDTLGSASDLAAGTG